ncbi:MAG TPA: hydantoinase/oxoprolinase family protein [Lacipirellulaceae bacterium]|nr:hydantoinase/oxoprolinase family protein [Lacipirellulaceae bacterium]
MTWLGLDIGGANLKAADGLGWARSASFPLWRDPHGLAGALATLIEEAPAADSLAVTMTGELCDCFRCKVEGVRHILSAVDQAARGREVRVYLIDGRFVAVAEAYESPQLAAASNWHALAQFACRFVAVGTGLLIDVGSTTTDVIPLMDGRVTARGQTDTERLICRELVYRGIGRTPVCAVVRELPWRGQLYPVAAEVFATTADAYLTLGDLPEDAHAEWTADGRPLTKENSKRRLARQICADAADVSDEEVGAIATAIRNGQFAELEQSIQAVVKQLPNPPTTCILSGSGEFLARAAAERSLGMLRLVSLAAEIGGSASGCAPSHAVAVLASQGGKRG